MFVTDPEDLCWFHCRGRTQTRHHKACGCWGLPSVKSPTTSSRVGGKNQHEHAYFIFSFYPRAKIAIQQIRACLRIHHPDPKRAVGAAEGRFYSLCLGADGLILILVPILRDDQHVFESLNPHDGTQQLADLWKPSVIRAP